MGSVVEEVKSLEYLRAIMELKALQCGQKHLPNGKWKKQWARWRGLLFTTREYKLFRAQVIVRANGYCERCKGTGEHVHHKIHVYKDPDLAIDVRNGEYLCVDCHKEEHPHLQ